MKLSELDAKFYSEKDRNGMGIVFECPHCAALGLPSGERQMLGVPFKNPLDGGAKGEGMGLQKNHWWSRTGDTIETLTLSPSINASSFGHWHGFIISGEIR